MHNSNHYIIIMAGGIGTRFWPMSRAKFPKQFHDVLGRGKSLIQETFDRFASFIPTENIYVVTNDRYFDLVKEQLPTLTDDQILLEPVGRNTAPCVAYACYKIQQKNPNAVYVVAPSDHLIADEAQFRKDIELGMKACEEESMIMTLGITPTRPDTGYGYIQFIEDENDKGYFKVKTFTEKPNLEVAKSFLKSGDFVWNSGIFLFSGKTIMQAFRDHLPEVAELFGDISANYYTEGEQEAIKGVYGSCKNISIDYGIMEKYPYVCTIPSNFGWSDLGTWGSVHENAPKDDAKNSLQGEIALYSAENNVIRTASKDKLIVVDGLEGYIVVDTDDALLICKKENEQFIKRIVGDMRERYGEQFV